MCEYIEDSEDIKKALQDIAHISTVLQHEYEELHEQRSSKSATARYREDQVS
jgi:hypothetical protein